MNTMPAIPLRGQSLAPRHSQHVLVIGGGASGVLMAAHLMAQTDRAFQVTIIEGRNMLGCGVAYSTTDPDHLLNTRALNMSAFPDQPRHFIDWLHDRPEGKGVTEKCFVSRATYGQYLAGLIEPWSDDGDRRIRCIQQTCVRLTESPSGVEAELDNGAILRGDMAVLATGHAQPSVDPKDALSGPWSPIGPADPDGRVVIIGTGLTMVDKVLSLLKSGHRGEILSISRRGLLPRGHTETTPLQIDRRDLPLTTRMSALLAWLRGLAREAEANGGTWRDAVDGVRPHVQRIWRSLPDDDRARFLRLGATWWDVHRHRIPPASAAVIGKAMETGQLVIQRARFLSADLDADGQRRVTFQPSGAESVTIAASRVIDCRGIRRDPEANASPLVAALLAQGRARVDSLRISLDVTRDCRLLTEDGTPSPRLFAIGPASRAAFWEITAIPDIRDQVAQIAKGFAVHEAAEIGAAT